MPININFNHLYYFHVIASMNSLVKATKFLKVSQPTLSHQLKLFEERLGHELFDRQGRSLELNKHGKYLLEYTQNIFHEVETMLTGFSYQLRINTDQQFRIGITPSVSKSYASRLLRPLFSDTSIGISIDEGDIESLINRMQASEVDFILTESPSDRFLNDGLEQIEITRTQPIFVCGKKFSQKSEQIPEDLHNAPYFKYTSENQLQRQVDYFFYQMNVTPHVVGESDDINIILSATQVNHCFAVVPDIATESLIKDQRIFKIGDFEQGSSSVCGLFLKDKNSDHIRETLGAIKNDFAGNSWDA